jgi:hypothetical protein
MRPTVSCLFAAALSAAAASSADAQAVRPTPRRAAEHAVQHWNLTTGAPLKAGVYGRVALRPTLAPPAVIYGHPLVATRQDVIQRVPVQAQPVYLYVPPGQVRRWTQHCHKWKACEEPVLFVRMDESPSRWGEWRQLREQVAASP